MRHFFSTLLSVVLFLCLGLLSTQAQTLKTDLLIIGGGASGTTAGIQAARMGVKVVIVEETPWLGGMLTSAGVSAIDGNHQMPSGLWGEFRQQLYNYYGGPAAVETGWVSNTLFEPSTGNRILKELVAKEKNLSVVYNTAWQDIKRQGNGWKVTVKTGKKSRTIEAKMLLDATELGDVMARAGAKYDIGMDSRSVSGEEYAPAQANDIVQDLTYVVILKEYPKGQDKTIKKPAGYNPKEFDCACDVSDPAADGGPNNNCLQMMGYGKLPNNKYMINWPKCGNDIYMNIIEKTPAQRAEALKEAKLHTLRFVYYLQTELGFKNFGIAEDEFPTADKLPMIPYHRESRRLKGLAKLAVHHVEKPYDQKEAYYRTGVAVGDYTIDHHHLKNPSAPNIDFVKIKVPSYNVPLGSLIPQGVDGLIVAEKSISVTNIVNGATRLQPVVLGLGQAAGALAAVSLQKNVQPREVNIRDVQQALLSSNAYIMPFIDVKPQDAHFAALQRIGATGILKGTGIAYKWANQTWFYPEYPASEHDVVSGLKTYYPQLKTTQASGAKITLKYLTEVLATINPALTYQKVAADWSQLKLNTPASEGLELTRCQAAVILDHFLNPFALPIDFNGQLTQQAAALGSK
ncbi:FAD-dependent oxidoreductase [Nibribacter ruber]|uniref:FAD-dependent oxidoreductase n=1 Tax=Nibribacter ruber TaxID=2698458 RepID=A0A6P1P1P4_9BACT|nr:FAD-dependent oxidoreductase [Nibribacter ruber]QHL87592.1 FAD-dependent oxidoreductase [Nibribacter ruber]